jgi:hypothetical protein
MSMQSTFTSRAALVVYLSVAVVVAVAAGVIAYQAGPNQPTGP